MYTFQKRPRPFCFSAPSARILTGQLPEINRWQWQLWTQARATIVDLTPSLVQNPAVPTLIDPRQ